MPSARLNAFLLQCVQHLMEPGDLQTGEGPTVRCLLIADAQVGKNAGDLHMRKLIQRRDLVDRSSRLPQPVHARIHLHLPAQTIARSFHLPAVGRIHDCLGQTVAFQQAELLRGSVPQHQNFPLHTTSSQLAPFPDRGHTEGLHPFFPEKLRCRFGTHAVTVRFDGRHQRTVPGKQRLQFPHVMAKCRLIHFHPGPSFLKPDLPVQLC